MSLGLLKRSMFLRKLYGLRDQKELLNVWWTGGDLNPRPPECKSGIHTRLNYQPFVSSFREREAFH